MSTAPLTDDCLVVQSQALPSGEIDDELMALDAKRGEILGLDKVGTEIWRMTASPVRVGDIVAALEVLYEAEPGAVRADTIAFLEELRAARLIETKP